MKIEVNIEKKHFFVIMATIFILAAIFIVNAYNTNPANPAIVGHSANEINWSETIDTLKVSHLYADDEHVNDICTNGGRCLSTTGAQGFHVSNSELYTGNCGADAKTTCPHRWCAARGWVSGIVVEWYNSDNYVVCFR